MSEVEEIVVTADRIGPPHLAPPPFDFGAMGVAFWGPGYSGGVDTSLSNVFIEALIPDLVEDDPALPVTDPVPEAKEVLAKYTELVVAIADRIAGGITLADNDTPIVGDGPVNPHTTAAGIKAWHESNQEDERSWLFEPDEADKEDQEVNEPEELPDVIEEIVVSARRMELPNALIQRIAADTYRHLEETLGQLPEFDVVLETSRDQDVPFLQVDGTKITFTADKKHTFEKNAKEAIDYYFGEGTANQNWYDIADTMNRIHPDLGENLLQLIDAIREIWHDPYWDTAEGQWAAAWLAILAFFALVGRPVWGRAGYKKLPQKAREITGDIPPAKTPYKPYTKYELEVKARRDAFTKKAEKFRKAQGKYGPPKPPKPKPKAKARVKPRSKRKSASKRKKPRQGKTPRKTGRYRLRLKVRKPRTGYPRRRRRDRKFASQQAYMGLLGLVNRTFGKLTELDDLWKVFLENVQYLGRTYAEWHEIRKYQKSGVSEWAIPAYDTEVWLLQQMLDNPHGVRLDMDGFAVGWFQETVQDATWALFTRAERNLVVTAFGKRSLIANAFGLPSNWVNRLTGLQTPFQAGASLVDRHVQVQLVAQGYGRIWSRTPHIVYRIQY